jgi:PPM family protein phosphatase
MPYHSLKSSESKIMSIFKRMFSKNEPTEPSQTNTTPSADGIPSAKPSYQTDEKTALFDVNVTRELLDNPEKFFNNGRVTVGHVSDMGVVRTNNEDAVYTFFASGSFAEGIPDFGVFAIADGMGGHQLGERASAIAVRTVAEYILSKIYLPMIAIEEEDDRPTISEVLMAAVKTANDLVIREIADGGTTLTVMVLIGEWAHFAHVGDSRAYIITKEMAEQITRDHSLVQRLIELNQLDANQSKEHPQRNVLYRAIGQSDNIEVDTLSRRLASNSYVMICTDGLWDVVSNHQIREIITTLQNPQQSAQKLVELAITQGSTDNVSSIIIKMPTG